MATRLHASRVATPDGLVGPATVTLEDGWIAGIDPTGGPGPHHVLAPGFVDVQVNGIGEHDVADPDADWDALEAALVAQGVTTWCPTLTSRHLDAYREPLERIAQFAGRSGLRPTVAGAHLEGPFLSPDFARAHPVEHLLPVDGAWLASLPEVVRVVTLAPELPGAGDAIRALVERGVVVALGHSGADLDAGRAAADAGATLVTHLFNAMAPLHHRRPGLVGAALTDPRLTVSLIADLEHVATEALWLAFAAKPADRVVLATDSVAVGGGRRRVEVRGGAPRLADGTIAGSVLSMDRAVANVVERVGMPLDAALRAAAETPARLLGLTDRGRVEVGARADLVALGEDLGVEAVWIGGRQALG